MKFVIQFVAILFSAHLLALFMPWYCIALAAFIMGYMLKSNANFLAGFLAIAALWTFNAWLIDSGSSSDLANRVANILPVKHKALLFLAMSLVGGVVGGFAALTGSLLRK
jgi:hypothetical protein